MVNMVQWTIQHRSLTIEFENLYENYHRLSFDAKRLQQVLLNLLTNACKFQKEGTIGVFLRIEPKDTVRLDAE